MNDGHSLQHDLSVIACSTVRRVGNWSLRFLSLAHRPWRNLHPRVSCQTEDTREPHRKHNTLVVVYKCIISPMKDVRSTRRPSGTICWPCCWPVSWPPRGGHISDADKCDWTPEGLSRHTDAWIFSLSKSNAIAMTLPVKQLLNVDPTGRCVVVTTLTCLEAILKAPRDR